MKRRYEKTIISHAGIREIESEIFEGYDPNNKRVWSKLAVDRDLAPSESNLNLKFVLNSNGILTQDRKPKKKSSRNTEPRNRQGDAEIDGWSGKV